MRLLVVSDSHNDFYTLNDIIKQQPTAEIIIHLGDGLEELKKIKSIYKDRMIIAVKGNCDSNSDFPQEEEITVKGYKIFMTHGNCYNVKLGIGAIYGESKMRDADILLFGHTHTPFTDFSNNMHVMNPGSLKGFYGSYGTIDITDTGVFMNIVRLNEKLSINDDVAMESIEIKC